MSAILLKTSPDGEQVLYHCGWCIPGTTLKRQIDRIPALKGFPVTTGICVQCATQAMSQATIEHNKKKS
jgi:hypothetical protein